MILLPVTFLKVVEFRLSIRCLPDPTRCRHSRQARGRNFAAWLIVPGGRFPQRHWSTLPLGDMSARLRELTAPNKTLMKAPTPKTERPLTDKAHDYSPPGKSNNSVIDHDTGRPVVRDLRLHRFIAHQRDYYFLNERADQ